MQQAAANGRRQRSRTEDEMAPIEDHVCAKLRPAFYMSRRRWSFGGGSAGMAHHPKTEDITDSSSLTEGERALLPLSATGPLQSLWL